MPAKWLCPSSYAFYEGSAATLCLFIGRDICLLFTWMIHVFKVILSTLVNEMSMPVIGMIIAALLPGVKHRALHYRTLESEKTAALCQNGDDYNGYATMVIHCWHTNVSTSHHYICAPPPDTTIYSDASLDGWDATNSLTTVGATWEDMPHINVLELYAAKLALTHMAANCQGSHIHLKLEKFTAVSYINIMGKGRGGGGGDH